MHDPGPWIQGKTNDSIITTNVLNTRPEIIEWYGGEVIAETVKNNNKPVIMAAPDLLTCLKWAMDWIVLWANDTPRKQWDSEFADKYEFALRTLLRAAQ